MRRRSKAGGEPKARRRNAATLKRSNAPKIVRRRIVPAAGRETEVARLTRELNEAIARQAATAEVLGVISSSAGELQPVFQAILANAVRICGAKLGNLFLYEEDAFRAVEMHGASSAYAEAWRQAPVMSIRDHPYVPLARVAKTKQIVHITDLAEERVSDQHDARYVTLFDSAAARTILLVPMLKESKLLGAIVIYGREVRPFTDKQIGLVQNFASQAVIAIENARLLNELRERTDDLSESLEQQTATSKVLEVISRSAFNLHAVFETVAESSVRLCGADRAFIFRFDGELLRMAVAYNSPPEFTAWVEQHPIRPGRHSGSARAALERRTIHIPDVRVDPEYTYGAKDAEAIRTVLGVPILKGDDLLGVMMIYHLEGVRPFTEKQIALVETFADQAAIAIENARLFEAEQQRTRELSESLEQQTATSEVLKVISSSPGELEPVFQAMLANAVRICDAKFGILHRYENESFLPVADFGLPPALAEFERKRGSFRPPAGGPLDRLLRARDVIHTADDAAEAVPGPAARLGGARSLIGVPMLKENVLVGAIIIYRQEVRPFTDKQIEVVQNFAAQAVIAIENTRLLNELRQRTADLTQSLENLRAAQDRLVQTEKLASLGQLTAGIAHEIKNPLNFVNNFSSVSVELIDELRQALDGGHLDAKLRAEVAEIAGTLQDNLDKVVQHGKRADAIVKNMLLHSRQGSGEHRPVDVNALVEESLNLAYHGARAEKPGFDITLERSFDPAAGEADLFPQEITRVLLNLISNGFYAATKRRTETNGGDYQPTLAAATKSLGDSIEIRIRDNGTGISPEAKEKLFNPFFTTKPAGEGTGLGLSISHDIIVKQHGGSIEVDTQPGEFTEFRIVLPRAGRVE